MFPITRPQGSVRGIFGQSYPQGNVRIATVDSQKQNKQKTGCVALTRVGTVSVHSMLLSAFIGRTTPRRVERQCWHLKKTISGTGFPLMSSVTEGLKYGRLDPGLSLLMVKISDHYLLGYCHLVELWAKGNTGESFIWDLTTPQSKGSEMGETWLLLI